MSTASDTTGPGAAAPDGTTSVVTAPDATAPDAGVRSGPGPDVTAPYRRLVRRESRASRSASAVVVLVVAALAAAWLGTEAVLAALGRPALLASPVDVLGALTTALGEAPGLVVAAGVAAAVVGVVLVLLGLTAGHRGRHEITDERVAAVVDDTVLAASLARVARTAGRLGAGQVTVWVSRREARVELTPASGVTVDEQGVLAAVRSELESRPVQPALRVTSRVADHGRLDA
ncbi:hypothetical protein F1C15_09515 [Frigoribacterium sp. NBH87]|uniref:hypothetical protein n=1 Tax=Frigoribacterium sp. NBH87 TaxID=2596916 RepID=UPI00162731CD|nr:hypothetical protein [Frigoribacterium sp. NBH87]QNE44015.1 hypothetical protein F1C15_09515 [Frigoribacterium sp. NBH87]